MKRNPPKNDAQIDLFAPSFGEIASRDGIDLMELPFFSLSKKRRFKAIRYENAARNINITVSGGEPHGIATIWDKDILIWSVSQIVEALDRGETPSKTIYFHPHQMLKALRRPTNNLAYDRLLKAMTRLLNTTVHTTHRTDKKTETTGFHWIENLRSAQENKTGEGIGMWSITLSDWIYKSALNKRLVLTLDDDYFLLTGGRERWLYGIARKHGGYQDHGFTISLRTLHEKSGTDEEYRYWAHEIRQLIKANELPGYHLSRWRGEDKQEYINFTRRNKLSPTHPAYVYDLPRGQQKRLPKRA